MAKLETSSTTDYLKEDQVKPVPLSVDPEGIPQELKDFGQWVNWRYVWDGKKWTKPPFHINGSKADKTNSDHWSDFSDVLAAYEDSEGDFDGIGFCNSPDDPYAFADLDDCLVDGKPINGADEIVSLLNSYTEKSPSGTGLRIIVKGKIPQDRKIGKVELYSNKAYLTITGRPLELFPADIEHRQTELNTLYKRITGGEKNDSTGYNWQGIDLDNSAWNQEDKNLCAKIASSNQSELFQKLFKGDLSAHNGDHSGADQALCNILAFWCRKDTKQMCRIFNASELASRNKWKSRPDYQKRTIARAIDGCKEVYKPDGNLTEGFSPVKEVEEVNLVVRDWPVLSEVALYGFAGRFSRYATENSEADIAAVLATFLVRFGVETSAPSMWIGDARHKSILAAVLVGSSSKSRKGTSGKPVQRLFQPMVLDSGSISLNRASTSPGPFSSGEGIIYAVRDTIMGVDKKTGEPIQIDPGVADKRLFIQDEEFAGAMAQTKREGNTLSMIVRAIWDSNTLDPLTKTSKIKATNPHIGWVSHITLNELNTRLSETEIFNGYANRILWVCARRSKLIAWPEKMDGGKLAEFKCELSEIIATHQDLVEMRPDQEVREAWQNKYYQELTQDKPGMVGCIINRAEAQVLRLAMVYSLLDKSHTIRIEHLDAALAFWNYCEDSAKYIFHSRQIDNVAQKIIDALQEGPLTGTDIHRLFHSHVSRARLESALSELTASDRISSEKQQTGGRPVATYSLNTASVLSVKSVKRSESVPNKPLNTLNTLFTQGENKKDSMEYEVEL